MDHIYAVLHSTTYQEKYKEFLKIDFPRVPYPKDLSTFWKLVKLGGEMRTIHLLESPVVDDYITEYPEDGNNVVQKPKCENGRVYIYKISILIKYQKPLETSISVAINPPKSGSKTAKSVN